MYIRGYVHEILKGFREAGYEVQIFSLNSATMEVPQSRNREFFIANNRQYPKLRLDFSYPVIVSEDEVCPCTLSSGCKIRLYDRKYLSDEDYMNVQTFPQDYDFCGKNVQYVCGMSVPPVMMAQIATKIWEQRLRA